MKSSLIPIAILAACGSKPEPTPSECGAAVEASVNVGVKVQVAGQGLTDAQIAEMKRITNKHCTEDKWNGYVVDCLKTASTNDAINTCLEGVPSAQRRAWQQEMSTVLAKSAGSGSGSGSGSALPMPSPAAQATLPAECVEYQKLMERLASCEAFPKPSRDAYQQAYAKVTADFEKQTEAGRAQLAQGCKTTVDVIRQSVSATCGW